MGLRTDDRWQMAEDGKNKKLRRSEVKEISFDQKTEVGSQPKARVEKL